MSVQAVAHEFVELCKGGKDDKITREQFFCEGSHERAQFELKHCRPMRLSMPTSYFKPADFGWN